MELSHEDTLRLNVLLASRPQAIRIDESAMAVVALSDKGEARVALNPRGRDEAYVRKVKELLSGHVLGSPGGYPVYLRRWTRMGQMRDDSLEQLLLLGEPEAVVAVVCAQGLTDELARRAWWAMPDAQNARHMLSNETVAKGKMGEVLAEYLVDYLPFETEPEAMMESVRLALQSGRLSVDVRQELWRKAARKNAYYVGFLAAAPDALFDQRPERHDLDEFRPRLKALSHAGNPYADLLLKLLSAPGQTFLATSEKLLTKPATQEVVTATFGVLAQYLRSMRPQGDPDLEMDVLIAEANEFRRHPGTEALRQCLDQVNGLAPDILAARILSGLGYGVLRPVFRDSSAIGSLMRRKLQPVTGKIIDQLAILQREKRAEISSSQ